MSSRRTQKQRIQELKQITVYDGQRLKADIIKTVIVCVTILGIFFFIKEGFVAFAGKTTSTNINVVASIFENTTISEIAAVLFGTGGVGFGYFSRRQRKDDIERLAGHNKRLEEALDRKRSSSGLSKTGDHHPGD